jgi:hypothetical protein
MRSSNTFGLHFVLRPAQKGTTEGRRLKQKLLDTHTNLASIVDFYTSNSDEYFLNKTVLEKLSKDALEKNIIDDLIQRKLFKRVFEIKIILTAHHPVEAEKLLLDLNGLRYWIIKYYINKDTDFNYEHIFVCKFSHPIH